MTRGFKRATLIAVLLLGAVVLAVLMSSLKQPPTRRELPPQSPLVEVLELRTSDENLEVVSQGTVRPRTETVLSAEVSGAITGISTKFIAGGLFQAGETLLRIDPTNYEVAVDQAEALVAQRQIEFDGASKLRSSGYRAESEYASAAAALASAKAELTRARRNLERTYIRLPYEGIVRAKEVDLGQFVNPGTRLGVAFATDVAEVRLPLTDQDLAFVELPEAGKISAAGDAPGPAVVLSAVQKGRLKEWNGRLVRSEGVVDEKSRVTYAVVRIEDPYRLHSDGVPLPVGTFVTARIDGAGLAGVIRVPRAALRGSDELLIVDAENQLRIRKVGVVRTDKQYAYISDGVTDGERISITPIAAPVDGMSVRVAGAPDEQRLAAGEEGSAAE